jgi:hypothetical protein
MRNVFQSANYIESEIVSNMLVANGIAASVNRHTSASWAGLVKSEVWIYDDGAANRAIALVRSFVAKQTHDEYRPNLGIAFILNLLGMLSVVMAFLQLTIGIFDGERVATAATFATIGAFLYAQGNAERRKVKHRAPSRQAAAQSAGSDLQ